MIVFTRDGEGKIVNDKSCIEQVQQTLEKTPGFDIVYDRGAYVLDVDVNDDVYVNDERQKVESEFAGCIAAVNKQLCDMPSVDLSKDRIALSGKFPENELRAGREFEFRNMLDFDAFELVEEMFPENML